MINVIHMLHLYIYIYTTRRVLFLSLLVLTWLLCGVLGYHVWYLRMVKPFSDFTYPTEADFVTLYANFKENGMLPTEIKPINTHPFHYIYLKQKCDFKSDKTVSLLILVKSSVGNFHLREGIRETWGKTNGENIEIVYLLGYRPEHQPKVDQEAGLRGDIIQESFIEAYSNNTYKTIMGFNWAIEYCHKANYIMFADDDHYLVLPNILIYINKLYRSNNANLIVGFAYFHEKPHRYTSSKWYVTIEEYQYDKYPPYLTAGAYLVSREVADKLVFSFPYVKHIWIDDIYISIVSLKLGIYPQHEPRFNQPSYLLHTETRNMVYHDFKTKEAFINVQKFLRGFPTDSPSSKMCRYSWKCLASILL
ncbi:beta-1,3-galactosyltransferase brn-like [Pecten maximus]|uniref:beta-1,3-galactosyltransferase brn-like n=1 Tax=Pecten maximus TaxID=6579 RepID=UPI0014581B90|nr:beta-1,3-galactosyltransferase brn-like [Pecten maximus]